MGETPKIGKEYTINVSRAGGLGHTYG